MAEGCLRHGAWAGDHAEKAGGKFEAAIYLREQAQSHLEGTKRHAEAVRSCREALWSDTSAVKTGVAQLAEAAKGVTTAFAQDQRVKDLLAAYASEHFEIACYKALRAGTFAAGEPAIAAVCDGLIPDEERMARWLDENFPTVMVAYLQGRSGA